jgi:hypothetical protein
VVQLELGERVSTKTFKTGQTFVLRLAEPVVENGRILIPAGASGVGEVIQSTRPGIGGKPAKLVLAARYLSFRRTHVPLQDLQISHAGGGRNNAVAAQVAGLSGIAFAPLGLVGFAVPGGHVDLPAGLRATAEISSDLHLASVGPAPDGYGSSPLTSGESGWGAIDVPPPPHGQGQVVFFRAKSVLGTGQWFRVRENGRPLGKLSNGSYFVQVTSPGLHTYTATEEPEMKDHLRLEVDPGATVYVEGELTKGLVLSAAALEPSNRAAFDKASKHLKLAPPPGAQRTKQSASDADPYASGPPAPGEGPAAVSAGPSE